MRKNLLVTLRILKRSKRSYVIISLQYIIATFLIIICFSQAYESYMNMTVFNRWGLNNVCIVDRFDVIQNKNGSDFKQVLGKLSNLKGYGYGSSGGIYDKSNKSNHATCLYSKDVLLNLKMDVANGRWFKDSDFANKDVYPIVISSDKEIYYKLGETYNLRIFGGTGDTGVFQDFKGKIIGFLEEPTRIFNVYEGGVDNVISSPPEGIMIMPYTTDFYTKGEIYNSYGTKTFLFPDDGIPLSEAYKTWKKQIGGNGDLLNFAKYNEKYISERKPVSDILMLICLLIVLISIASIGGINSIENLKQEKNMSVRFLCGMKWDSVFKIVTFRDIILILLPIVFSLWISNVFMTSLKINTRPFIFYGLPLIMALVSYFLTSFIPAFELKKKNPISIIRKWG